jgi:CRP-like cAMP-binding protein
LLVKGFAARYKVLQSGKRQITAIHVAGDFVDLHGFLLKKMDHAIVALTPCTIATVAHDTLREITERHPHLARLLWLSTLIDSAIHREWLVAMGRRSAREHMAHLFCELYLRLQLVGLTKDNSYEMPITQAELGDTLGISTVHVNRVVQELRGDGLITWRGNRLTVDDWDRLQEVAEFTPTYLSLFKERR